METVAEENAEIAEVIKIGKSFENDLLVLKVSKVSYVIA